jgi:hypothetical protein
MTRSEGSLRSIATRLRGLRRVEKAAWRRFCCRSDNSKTIGSVLLACSQSRRQIVTSLEIWIRVAGVPLQNFLKQMLAPNHTKLRVYWGIGVEPT